MTALKSYSSDCCVGNYVEDRALPLKRRVIAEYQGAESADWVSSSHEGEKTQQAAAYRILHPQTALDRQAMRAKTRTDGLGDRGTLRMVHLPTVLTVTALVSTATKPTTSARFDKHPGEFHVA